MLTFLPTAVPNPLRQAWADTEPDVVRVAMAFASETGVDELRDKVLPKAAFNSADKEWLIGIQDGVTHPKALEVLRRRANSSVRVPFGAAVLADPALRAPDFFHPKLYYFENSSTERVAIVSTSANLTLGGLASNVEQALVWHGGRSDPAAVALRDWWEKLWGEAEVVTDAFLSQYEARRPKPPLRKRAQTKEPSDSALRKAASFWIELTRKPEGGSYNQIELLLNGHLFFFPKTKSPSKTRGHEVVLEDSRGNVYADRQVTYHGPPRFPGGNGMWRVYMPTLAMGFHDYQDGDVLVRFERTGEANRYRLDVTPANSPLALTWMDESTVVEHPGPPPHRMGWA